MTLCDDIRPQLTAFIDQELSTTEANAVQEHVAACAVCRRALAEFQTLRQTLVDTPPSATIDVWPAVSAQLAVDTEMALLLAEIRHMREELQSLRGEVAFLRREIAVRRPGAVTRSSSLSFPDAPGRSAKPYQLV